MGRAWVVFALFSALYLIIFVRLFYWQIVSGERLRVQAAAQYFLELSLPAARGNILASDSSPIVINKNAYLVYAQPKEIVDPGRFTKDLTSVLHLDPQIVLSAITTPGRVWVPLEHKIDSQTVAALQKLGLSGVGFEKEPVRYYPESSAAAQLLGFVGSDQNGDDVGYFGLEGYYDRQLRGRSGSLRIEKDVKGAPILVGDAKRIEPENGRTMVLWIDRAIQHIAEKRLLEGLMKYGAKNGTVTILDPKTGGVLAMAAYPNYDPSAFGSFDKELYRNLAVASTYEPGSTFKSLIVSAGLQERLITPNTTMNENGPIEVGGYYIRTWNNEYHGEITMTDVLEHSSNVGMVYIQKKLGKEKLLKYIKDFGFGQATGIDVEDESSPGLRPDSEWKDIDLATASFGQGIAVTPLQMVRAVAALANDGWLMEPHVVREMRDSRGKVIAIPPKRLRQVVSPQTASETTEMMVTAVDKGEAKWAKPKGYRIAGKTGTAQVPVAGHYDDKKTIASFVGFAPADDPQFVMLVTLGEPTSSQWGSETAAPLFFAIASDIFAYKNIAAQ